jgi:hypothetical protein
MHLKHRSSKIIVSQAIRVLWRRHRRRLCRLRHGWVQCAGSGSGRDLNHVHFFAQFGGVHFLVPVFESALPRDAHRRDKLKPDRRPRPAIAQEPLPEPGLQKVDPCSELSAERTERKLQSLQRQDRIARFHVHRTRTKPARWLARAFACQAAGTPSTITPSRM